MKEILEVDPEVLAQHPHVLSVVSRIGEEIYRRKTHPYYAYKADDHADRPQLAFHKSEKRIRLVFGGNQSGKSRCVAQELAWWLCEDHPYQKTPKAPKVYLLSNTMRTIQEGVYRHLQLILPEWMIEDEGPMIPGYLMPSFIIMKNGSHLDFLSGDGREDARRRLQSAAIDLAVIDEEVDLGIWRELQVRRLSRSGRVVVAATLVRSEPWCLDLEDQAESGSKLVDLYRFSTYRARDCGHVSAEVVEEIEGTSTPEEIAIRLSGKSRRSEGLVYSGFDSKKHVVEPFEIPKDWTRYCAIDPGWNTCAVLWIAVSPEDKYIVYREIYSHNKHLHVIADQVHAAEGYTPVEIDDAKSPTGKRKVWKETESTEQMRVRWIDPSAFGFHETGEKRVGTLLGEAPYNLPCAPARNDVESGIEIVARSFLSGYDGLPRLRVFRTCENFLKEIRSYRRAQDSNSSNQNAKKDAPIKRHDHLMDCLRYLFLGVLRYVPPMDPAFKKCKPATFETPVRYSKPIETLMRNEWQRMVQKQTGHNRLPPHVGGIGDQY